MTGLTSSLITLQHNFPALAVIKVSFIFPNCCGKTVDLSSLKCISFSLFSIVDLPKTI